jgi:hypothetical protein
MIKFNNIFFLIFVAVSISWIACEKERDPCLQPIVNPLRFGIYQPADTGSLGRDSVLPAAIIGLADSQVVRFYGAKSSKFSVLLSPVSDSVKWYIVPDTSDQTMGDSITFYYQKQLHFISTGCGYTYYYNLTNVTSTNNRVDSVKITNPLITNEAKIEHVKIFY